MFSGLMLNAWASASIVAVVAGVVGFFIVLQRLYAARSNDA
jgi:ABC-type Mn2+/Zn2+ transport system permease subunit